MPNINNARVLMLATDGFEQLIGSRGNNSARRKFH